MSLPDIIDPGHSEKYTLSIRLKKDGLSFTIYEEGVGKSFCYKEFVFAKELSMLTNLEQIVFDNNFLVYNYKKVNIDYVSSDYDLIPEYLYEEKHQDKIFNFTHFENQGEILRNEATVQDNVLVFSVNKDVHSFLIRNLQNPSFYHYIGQLIPYFAEKAKVIQSNVQMFVHFHDKMTDIFCYRNGTIFQIQSYNNIIISDVVYYILNLWEKCDFDQNTDRLFISGLTENLSEMVKDISKYVKNISTIGMPSEVQFLTKDAANTPLDLLIFSL
ncbi:MAG: DUF3822 family protein [Dysgonomonas sp.]